MNPFIICGMPRSRTAWLSAVCNMAAGVTCYHEPTAWLARWEDVVPLLTSGGAVGASDHGLTWHLPELLAAAPASVLVVERPRGEVEASMRRLGFSVVGRALDMIETSIDHVRRHPSVRFVQYCDLADSVTVTRCLRWLVPRAEFDAVKVDEMQRLNIQADMTRVRRDIALASPERVAAAAGADFMRELAGGVG